MFRKGQSGNPGGRPKGFGEYIRRQTKEGKELVDVALQVLRGQLEQTVMTKDGPVTVGPTIRDRLTAIDFLADRGFGRVPQPISGDKGEPIQFIFGVKAPGPSKE